MARDIDLWWSAPPPRDELTLGDPRFNAILNPPTNDARTPPSHSPPADLAHLLRFGSDRTLEDTTRDVNRFISRDPTMTDREREELISSFIGMGNITRRITNPIRAYHGSPHRFEGPFRLDRVGTGEGSQEAGYGLNFAGWAPEARAYGPHSYDVNLHLTEGQLLHPGRRAPRNLQEARRLAEQEGIHGLAYRSRMENVPPGTDRYNYLVWSPEVIEILRRYGLLGPAVGGIGAAGLADRPQ